MKKKMPRLICMLFLWLKSKYRIDSLCKSHFLEWDFQSLGQWPLISLIKKSKRQPCLIKHCISVWKVLAVCRSVNLYRNCENYLSKPFVIRSKDYTMLEIPWWYWTCLLSNISSSFVHFVCRKKISVCLIINSNSTGVFMLP